MSYEEKDQKTVEAIDKIKAILSEYDLWAAITVVSQERSHWLYHFNPSWSCLHINSETGEARIKAIRRDFATPEQHQRIIELTTGAIIETSKMAEMHHKTMNQLIEVLNKRFAITHARGDIEYKKG